MRKPYLMAGAGLIIVILLFTFGRTTEDKKAPVGSPAKTEGQQFIIRSFIDQALEKCTPSQKNMISLLTNRLNAPDLNSKILHLDSLAIFWKDSIHLFEPYAYYNSEAAKLENSEKKLTFAAQLFLNYIRKERDEAKLNWGTIEAINLFERAILLNPADDDLRIGLGSSYVYGKGRTGNPQETMKGIQELLSVARKDSNNMKVQIVLGVGGMVSGQYDKALERFNKVVSREPANVEAIAYLADAYAAKGDKVQAVKWYTLSKRLVNDAHYTKEVDERIKMLK